MIGRFIQEDTYYGDGLNLYEYCRNNTITYKDPTGHNICATQRDLYHKYKEEGMSPQEAYQKMRKELGLDSKSGYKDSGVGNGKDPWRSYESGSGTGTVWDNITPTQENYPYTNIPKSFEIEVNGEKMWVHGNATEHMYEDVYKGITTGNGTAYTNPNLYTQEIMSDFCGSLQEATKSGIVYGEKITQGNWEFIFAQPRQAGQLPVIKHAQFNGWH